MYMYPVMKTISLERRQRGNNNGPLKSGMDEQRGQHNNLGMKEALKGEKRVVNLKQTSMDGWAMGSRVAQSTRVTNSFGVTRFSEWMKGTITHQAFMQRWHLQLLFLKVMK